MMIFIVILAIVAFVIFAIVTYNTLVAKIEAVENSKRQIDVQLDSRFKIFQGLLSTVRKVMDYEQTVLKEVVQLRSQAQAAKSETDAKGNPKEPDYKAQFAAEEKISQIAGQMNVVFEQYPQLGALDNVKHLQEEIVSTERKLAFSKQAYNDSIEDYNIARKSFFGSIIVMIDRKKLDHDYAYWQLSEVKHKELDEMTAEL